MLLCVASWNRAGGISALFKSYYNKMKIAVPHLWALIGPSPFPPSLAKKNAHAFFIEEDWKFYLDKDLYRDIKKQLKTLVQENNIKGLFLPLEYHLFPFIRDIKLPILYISHLLNKPLIESAEKQWYANTPEAEKGLKADHVRLQVEREALSVCRYIICNSDITKQGLLKYYRTPEDSKVFVSEPGVSKSFWRNISLGDKTQALYFGRLTHQKGIPNLIKMRESSLGQSGLKSGIFQDEKKEPENSNQIINVLIMGQGRMKSLIKSSQEQGNERHTKNQKSMKSLVKSSREQSETPYWMEKEKLREYLSKPLFCLFPSHYEPWGLSLNEALAAGKICIAQKGAGGHELQIQNGVNGILADFNTDEALSKIKETAEDEGAIRLLSKNAKNSAKDISDHIQSLSRIITQFYSEECRK